MTLIYISRAISVDMKWLVFQFKNLVFSFILPILSNDNIIFFNSVPSNDNIIFFNSVPSFKWQYHKFNNIPSRKMVHDLCRYPCATFIHLYWGIKCETLQTNVKWYERNEIRIKLHTAYTNWSCFYITMSFCNIWQLPNGGKTTNKWCWNHCCQMTPNDNIDLGQLWLR